MVLGGGWLGCVLIYRILFSRLGKNSTLCKVFINENNWSSALGWKEPWKAFVAPVRSVTVTEAELNSQRVLCYHEKQL